MKANILLSGAAALSTFAAGALELADKSDLAFAEAYAFSTNRAALVATLQPESKAWFTYSILNAQTEGRLEESADLLQLWKMHESERSRFDGDAYADLLGRNIFMRWTDKSIASGEESNRLRYTLNRCCGIEVSPRERERPLAPNTYPSSLDQKEVSFDSFLRTSQLCDSFAFLMVAREGPFADPGRTPWLFSPNAKNLLPDTPGLFEAALAWLKSDDRRRSCSDSAVFRDFTLAQLDALAKELKGTPKDLRSNSAYAELVLSKIAWGADDDHDDAEAAVALARRRLAFVDTLLPALDSVKRDEYRSYLKLRADRGEHAVARAEFAKYLDIGLEIARRSMSGRADGRVAADDVVSDYIAAYRRAGDDLSAYADKVEQTAFARICAEADLLAGRDPKTVDTEALPPAQFKSIQERVELEWSKSCPKVFSAAAAAKLSLDVKNVRKLRLAIYALDPFDACRILGGEAKADLDLDAAVPTATRTFDYSSFASAVRHTETFDLPELGEPGVYVVDATGAGVAARALIRKGRLRVTNRHDSSGYVFTALDETGAVVKGTRLRLGETVFTADETGEIAVPFATDEKTSGTKTAVATDGRLAAGISFEHAQEKIHLDLGVVLPAETLVAGCKATALLRPRLVVTGATAPLALLKNPVLTATFADIDGRESVRTFPGAVIADDAETAVSFVVPARLSSVKFSLRGRVESAATGRMENCCATTTLPLVNGISGECTTGQAFLRRTSSGWRLELRGRTGEPLAARPVVLRFRHVAFATERPVSLQADAGGVVELGPLADISTVRLEFEGHEYKWSARNGPDNMPVSLSASEGEDFRIPVRNLLDGSWPGAGKLRNRIALFRLTDSKDIADDCFEACSYANGVLTVSGLAAGDYMLFRRDDSRGRGCMLHVAKANPKTLGAGGVIASAARSLTDIGDPALLRISSARVAANGVLTVRLDNATEGTRVHVYAARTRETGSSSDFASELNRFFVSPDVSTGTWGGKASDYVSGRDLGDELRYVLDRRDQPHRTGNMLFKPSLLLAPWSTTETETTDVRTNEGDGWAPRRESAARRSGGFGGYSLLRNASTVYSPSFACYDFLPQAAAVLANLKPDAAGSIIVPLSAVKSDNTGNFPLPWQDIVVVATDGRTLDHVEILGEAAAFTPRNLAHRTVASAEKGSMTKSYATVGDLFGLLMSLQGSDASGELGTFAPLASWATLSDEEKRAFYGEHVSHEVDFFICMKDRVFFDAVVAPHLRNKRFRDFMDKWLLGDDLAEYAEPGRLDELNALEQGLLAQRIPALAPVVARKMADKCEANPTAPEDVDKAFDIALDAMNQDAKKEEMQSLPAAGLDEGEDFEACEEAGADYDGAPVPAMELSAPAAGTLVSSPVKMRSMVGSRSPASPGAAERRGREVARRMNRQLYRPPERTREWVESYWWRRRRDVDGTSLVGVSEFWRDWTAAIAAGRAEGFLSQNVCLVGPTVTEQLAALALTDLPFAAKEGDAALVFMRKSPHAGEVASPIVVTQRFRDPRAARADGSLGAEVKDEFVRGRVYELVTVMTNPTDEKKRISCFAQIPEGAIALGGSRAADAATGVIGAYSVETEATPFYFPEMPGDDAAVDFARAPATVVEMNGAQSASAPFTCHVVAKPSRTDETSWEYVSQNGTKNAVLDYLAEKNLADVDLSRILWRMKDGEYARRILDVLSRRGVYSTELWLSGLAWRDAYDAKRFREAFMRRENLTRLAKRLGPVLDSPLLTIEPEAADVFEHKEYWPIVSARAHAVGGRTTIPNEGLKAEYRAFLDMLAAKKAPDARDRILAAVYLIAQERIAEAKNQVRLAASHQPPASSLQLAYLNAYLAFCDGDAAKGKAVAAPYADYPVPLWRDRFRDVIAQADEALGLRTSAAKDEAAAAPTLALTADGDGLVVTARNLEECTIKAYPTDVEVAFSKDPFGDAAKGRDVLRCVRPAWTSKVGIARGEARVEIPKNLLAANLVVVAEGAEGRAEARLDRTPRNFDVQVTREYRQLRVKGADGKPLAGVYVKVYAKDASGSDTQFHKDGYTDLRGAFDYASVSTDSPFRPASFAILVIPDGRGAAILRVENP